MERIIVYLNGKRGLGTVQALLAAGHGISCAVVPLAQANGDLAQACAQLGIAVLPSANVNSADTLEYVGGLSAELGIIAGYSQIFGHDLINLPKLGTINLHGGRVPKYRGGSPLNWQMINGEKTAGISILRVDERIDAGPVLAETVLPIVAEDTIAELHERAIPLFAQLVVDVVDGLDAGSLVEHAQDEAQAQYWHQRNDLDGRIDWVAMTAREVHNLVRGITRPYPGAHSSTNGGTVRIWRTRLRMDVRGVPGRVCYIEKSGPWVVCREGAVILEEYETADGARLKGGSRLG